MNANCNNVLVFYIESTCRRVIIGHHDHKKVILKTVNFKNVNKKIRSTTDKIPNIKDNFQVVQRLIQI